MIGVPVVSPWYTPDRICTVSDSWRCVTWREVPGLRRSRSGWMSASDKAMPGGQPSITQPMAGPCDSPKLVTRKRVPRVLPDIESRGETKPLDYAGGITRKPPCCALRSSPWERPGGSRAVGGLLLLLLVALFVDRPVA